MTMDLLQIATRVVIIFVPFLFSLCFHEYAHGWVARLRGDRTAEQLGRLTLNPLAHADPIGTFALPILSIAFSLPIFFGWAKPVPVNPRNFKSPKSDMFWVALAGPASNVLLALVGSFLISIVAIRFSLFDSSRALVEILKIFITTNLFLAFFNLIPVHPLDGSRILARFLPDHLNRKIEENEVMLSWVLMILVLSGALKILSVPVLWTSQMFVELALRVVG